MKNLFYLVVVLSFFLTTCSKTSEKTGSISVLTYNVAGLPEGISQSRPSKYTSIIGELINEYEIVHVQEDFNYHNQLKTNTNHTYKTKWSGPAGFGDGLNTFSMFPIHKFERYSWNHCNGTDCLTPKGFSFSRIEVAKGVLIDFYNIHANAGSENPDLSARRQNIFQLIRFIENNSKGTALVVMGDFNCRYTRSGDRIKNLTEIGLIDIWVELKRDGVYPEANDIALRDCEDMSGPDCEVVDKIFYRSGDKVTLTAEFFQHDDERYYLDGKPISDHFPMFAKLKYSTNF